MKELNKEKIMKGKIISSRLAIIVRDFVDWVFDIIGID